MSYALPHSPSNFLVPSLLFRAVRARPTTIPTRSASEDAAPGAATVPGAHSFLSLFFRRSSPVTPVCTHRPTHVGRSPGFNPLSSIFYPHSSLSQRGRQDLTSCPHATAGRIQGMSEQTRSRPCLNILSVLLPVVGFAVALMVVSIGVSRNNFNSRLDLAYQIWLGFGLTGCACGLFALFRRERLWGITAVGLVFSIAAATIMLSALIDI